ncbi:MAG: class I SAM-dependent methyltransferase, partial [Helicobacter sp.]|uniref:TylF/MycF/NovP-related O-methyltransferase n=1 Tax=Helicobacter sp. TaxID=218 RepID=UPI0025BB0179
VIVGTFTGYYEISAQLQEMGVAKEKIDVSYIELSVRARIAFLEDFAKLWGNLQGAVAELGVYRGDFARYINAAFAHRKLYLFDTFEGFAKTDVSRDSTMAQNLGAKHFANTSVELVLSKMPNPTQCVIQKGWFPQSALGLEKEQFCFVNLDADLYEPILAGLEFFYPRMVKNGVILIHEYFSQGYVGVKEAVEAFIKAHKEPIYKMPIGDSLSIALIKTS